MWEATTQKPVVHEWFKAPGSPMNVRCMTGKGAALLPRTRGSRHPTLVPTHQGQPAGPAGDQPSEAIEAPWRCPIIPPGQDSDSEVVSHNPTDGTFAPLEPRPSTYTRCLDCASSGLRITMATTPRQWGTANLSHSGPNPAHVP